MLYVLACLVLILTSHPMSRSAKRLLSSCFLTKNLCEFLFSPMCTTSLTHLILLDLTLFCFSISDSDEYLLVVLVDSELCIVLQCACRVRKIHTVYFHIFAVHFLLCEPQFFIWGVLLYFWIFLLLFKSFYMFIVNKDLYFENHSRFFFCFSRLLTHWGRGLLNCLNARSRGLIHIH